MSIVMFQLYVAFNFQKQKFYTFSHLKRPIFIFFKQFEKLYKKYITFHFQNTFCRNFHFVMSIVMFQFLIFQI